MKVLGISIIETNDLYGYSCIVLPLSETNLIEIERLKKVFTLTKKVDEEINQLTYYNSNLDFTLLTTEFDTFDFSKSDIVVDDITEEEFNDASDFDECEYSVDSPLVRLDAYGLQFVYPCSNTSDEVYGSLNFSELSELLTKL